MYKPVLVSAVFNWWPRRFAWALRLPPIVKRPSRITPLGQGGNPSGGRSSLMWQKRFAHFAADSAGDNIRTLGRGTMPMFFGDGVSISRRGLGHHNEGSALMVVIT